MLDTAVKTSEPAVKDLNFSAKAVILDNTTIQRYSESLVKLATVKDSYPLPRIDDTIDALGGARYFSTLDLASGYWQIPIAERDKEKTAFVANNKLYQFNVMPFGLCNAPATFQRLMDTILRNLSWKYCLVYLDDIIVFSADFATHVKRLGAVMTALQNANLKLQPNKCKFAMQEVDYLGFNISADGLQPDRRNIKSILDMAEPKSKDEVRRCLGMMSYYRRFVANFASTAACLFELTKKDSTFIWTDETKNAFNKLKTDLVKAPILIYPNFSKEFEIFCDASNVAIGAALVQRLREIIHPVAYASKQLNKHERAYSTTEKELLAIVWAAKHFKSYIYGRHINFFSDHKPLSTLKKASEPNGRLYRLLLKLQDLDYDIIYQPGKLNLVADLLSRPPVVSISNLQLNFNVDWALEQSLDKEIAQVRLNV